MEQLPLPFKWRKKEEDLWSFEFEVGHAGEVILNWSSNTTSTTGTYRYSDPSFSITDWS